MKYPSALEIFLRALADQCPAATVEVDAPRDPKGEWMLDVSSGRFQLAVAWRPELGFGVFVCSEHGFGDRPDEIYKKAEAAARRVCGLIAQGSDGSTGVMRLKELRRLVGAPQARLAESLRINQAAVSRFEGRRDMLVSSLAQYVRAIGGHLELRAKFNDFEVRIEPSSEN